MLCLHRYLPPHIRQVTQQGELAANSTTPPPQLESASLSPDQLNQDQTGIQDVLSNEAAEAEMRRQRKFREGFAAYTAPPLLSKRFASTSAVVRLLTCSSKLQPAFVPAMHAASCKHCSCACTMQCDERAFVFIVAAVCAPSVAKPFLMLMSK